MAPAGRPKLPGKIELMLTMQKADREHLEWLGCGNASAGLRVLIDRDKGKQGHQRAKYCIVRILPSGRRVRHGKTGYSHREKAESAAAKLRAAGMDCEVAVKFRTAIPHE